MNCYKCGCQLSEKDFCTACGADVYQYKRIIYTSNRYYNSGLEKAQVRDISGAIIDLRQSLKLNKTNTQARNLLGLCYFEIGDTVEALTEWVISKNYQSEKNLADDYIDMCQSNTTALDSINDAASKYNKCLAYCKQGDFDMAKIQLKKIVSMNPRLLRARTLLALLFIKDEEWPKARHELLAVRKVDNGNTQANRYLKEAEEALKLEDPRIAKKRKKEEDSSVKSYNGNDMIIQPNMPKESTALGIFLNVFVGLVVGLIIGWFLLGPIRVNLAKNSINDELGSVRDELAAKSAVIEDLNTSIENLKNEKDALNDSLLEYKGTSGTMGTYTALLNAASEFNKGDFMDKTVVAGYLDQIDDSFVENEADDSFKQVYYQLKNGIGEGVAGDFYEKGYDAYKIQDYNTAIVNLEKAVSYNSSNTEAMYILANSYREFGDFVKAREYYERIVDVAPGSEIAQKAQTYISELDTLQ